ncbi:MAG TPA: hypothetical protein VHB77_07895 [Planctomycetaceae bacterium]|nr:hypothetical protein [Planctomycetaceae bacterium]
MKRLAQGPRGFALTSGGFPDNAGFQGIENNPCRFNATPNDDFKGALITGDLTVRAGADLGIGRMTDSHLNTGSFEGTLR